MTAFECRDPAGLSPPSMPANILLTGSTGFLGGHFLLRRILWQGNVYALVRGDDVSHARARLYAHLEQVALSYGETLPREALDARLIVLLGDITQADCGLSKDALGKLSQAGISQFWHCAASLKFEDRHRQEILEHNIGGTGQMLDLFNEICGGAAGCEFIHISTAYSAGLETGNIAEALHSSDRQYNNVYEESKNLAENQVAEYCTLNGLSYRILRPSVVMGPRLSHQSGTTRFGVYGLTKEIFRLRDTLKQMEHPLELVGEVEATVNLTAVDECVYDMLALAASKFGSQRVYHLCNPQGLNVKRMIEMIDSRTGANKLQVVSSRSGDPSPLQALFDKRTAFYSGYYRSDKRFERALPPQPQMGWQDIELYLACLLQELRQEEAGGVGFRPHIVHARDGAPLRVFSLGDTKLPPLVLANAYGMPAEFMWNLAQRLANDFHVLTWECRWVPSLGHSFDENNCGSLVHANDLADIIEKLGLGSVTVAGWSSGAQVSLRAMAEYPELIQAGILLNPGVSISPSESVRVTRFETGIRSLFPKIASSYRMAKKYCELIFGAEAQDAGDRQALSSILTSTDPYLLYMTSLPFRTPESLFRYAHMMHALFSERPDAWTHDVKQPVLVYVGDQDQVTHPDIGHALCRGLAQGHLHQDPQGDHFGHYYDARIAELIIAFARQHAPTPALA